jgi:quercetin dioxygenase-like cupin family protein
VAAVRLALARSLRLAPLASLSASREILKKTTGNVTLFAFDQDQGLNEHTAPFDALVQLLEGEAEVTISGKPYKLHGGEMILMPAGQPHALKALQRFKMILTMIRS